jgi:hypothetical protein
MFKVMEKVFGIEEDWDECVNSFRTMAEAMEVQESWERAGRFVWIVQE